MAGDACDPAVGAGQRKLGRGMIETRHLGPVRRVVAGLAAGGGAIGPARLHSNPELVAVRVLVTARAGPVLEVEFDRGRGARGRSLVTVRAYHCQVRPGQRESCELVLGERKQGGLKTLEVVAALAAIGGRRGCKLSLMNILVALLALHRSDLENCVLALRQVALLARHRRMAALQRILCCGVQLRVKCGRFEAVFGMARRALSLVRSGLKLPPVGIPVAIRA